MASFSVTSRSARGVRAEGLVRFLAETLMAAPGAEKPSTPSVIPVELSDAGKAFFESARAFVEDAADGGSAANIKGFLGLIVKELPRLFDTTVPDVGARDSVASVVMLPLP